MDVRFLGTGGLAGWPEPGCRCASCRRAAAAGGRRPGALLADGALRVEPGRAPAPDGTGHQVTAVPGGWDITGPDGGRLLAAAGPGQVPRPPAGTAPYGLLVLDLLADPAQLGDLRARGLAPAGAMAAAGWADHRVTSPAEMARRCGLWRAVLPADGDTLAAGRAGPDGRTGLAGDPVLIQSTLLAWEQGQPGGTGLAWATGPDWSVRASWSTGPADGPHRTLVLGGARSGKSAEAELRLAGEPAVTYLAAGPGPDGVTPDDPEWAARVAAHQARRPGWWVTLESTDVAGALRRLSGAVLIDGIGTWLTAMLTEAGAWPGAGPGGAAGPHSASAVAARIDDRIEDLIAAWRECEARIVAVSDEVGGGIVPGTAAGRLFRDQLGWLNQRLAAESDETVLVAAGRVIALPA